MDISAFSDDNFNAAEWINSNFKQYLEENGNNKTKKKGEADENTEERESALAFINASVSKLQLYVQQVNFAVEQTSVQLVDKMPGIAKETKLMYADVQRLKKHMQDVQQDVSAVREETGECMATLERLNTLQTKLQAAKESLQESDGWGNLISELEDCFERNDLKGVCEKLISLQKSLQAQEQLPGHAERQTQMEDFKNRLEALASPSVVQCFAEGNIENSQRYVQIFISIQRLPQLQQYYRAVQKNLLQQTWKQTLDVSNLQNQQSFLNHFYDQLLENCQRQVKWCLQVFEQEGEGQFQPFLVIAELLTALEPTRDAHILQVLKTSNERLDLLIQYAQANEAFVLHLNAFLEQSNINLSQELQLQIGEAIYEYFHKFIQQYPRLEETQLSTQIDRLIVNQPSLSDAVRHLDDSNRKAFEWLKEACHRCKQITNDLALCKLIALMGQIFKRILENFTKTQRQLSLSIGVSAENWSLLQYSMSLLQCLGDFQLKLNKFEETLHERMFNLKEKFEKSKATAQNSTINIYATYERNEQKRLLTAITEYQQKRNEAGSSINNSLGIFDTIYETLKNNFSETHDITLNILLQPIEAQLRNIQPAAGEFGGGGGGAGGNSTIQLDMPSFSFAPQECITQIGQYLLTLPQHLEPLLLSPSPLLKQALELCNVKYAQCTPCADILLSLVVEQCCLLYQTQILQIKSLHNSAAKQISVDIEYLSSVVEELGLTITTHLSQILTLLKASPDNYLNLSSGCEPRLVTAIRQMRNIISTQ